MVVNPSPTHTNTHCPHSYTHHTHTIFVVVFLLPQNCLFSTFVGVGLLLFLFWLLFTAVVSYVGALLSDLFSVDWYSSVILQFMYFVCVLQFMYFVYILQPVQGDAPVVKWMMTERD